MRSSSQLEETGASYQVSLIVALGPSRTALSTGSAATASWMRVKAARIVRRSARPQAHLITVSEGDHPVSVELDLMEPAGARWWPLGESRLAGQDEAGRLRT